MNFFISKMWLSNLCSEMKDSFFTKIGVVKTAFQILTLEVFHPFLKGETVRGKSGKAPRTVRSTWSRMNGEMALPRGMCWGTTAGTNGVPLMIPRNVKTRNRSEEHRMIPAGFWDISSHAVGHTITVSFATFGCTSFEFEFNRAQFIRPYVDKM